MPVVKGGVWTNIEDEILKASVSKYGLNQWARVSSLLARKTAKQCKARWTEWLDPGIRKIEWSREEDEKLLHLAKLMPTQWRTIAPIVGRTATQCLERYQKLLDEAEARENAQELGLMGQEGGEASAPSADDVRKLRPGELDPEPESKPARPDTIDMDEDEKEMLSEARARLANTQGKKAKRKARERQLEESRRMAQLQKRRELKSAGINVKVTTRKKGQMDYNADIPFEKAPAPGFFDTADEQSRNEHQRQMFDPRKQQLANKRKGDQDDDGQDHKKRRNEKDGGSSAFAAAAKAGQLQRIREAEQSSKRKGLVLPAPQVSESELEDIIKTGISGDRASALAGQGENEATRDFVGKYQNQLDATPMRTPMAPKGEDRIANELRNAKARTETQSALFGGDNTPLHEGGVTTGYEGVAPTKQTLSTPNPLATPLRQQPNGAATGATPMRTPARDNLGLNREDANGALQLASQTPRDLRLREQAARSSLRDKLSSLPKPKETEWEFDIPEEQTDAQHTESSSSREDAAVRDARAAAAAEAKALANFRRQSSVVQKGLPRPTVVDVKAIQNRAAEAENDIEREIAAEMALLMSTDAQQFHDSRSNILTKPIIPLTEEEKQRAHLEVVLELGSHRDRAKFGAAFELEWERAHTSTDVLPGLAGYAEEELDEQQLLVAALDNIQERITSSAEKGIALEKKLSKHHGGYMARQKTLKGKLLEASKFLEETDIDVETQRRSLVAEEASIAERLENLRAEVAFVRRREREAQDVYRERRDEFDALVA